jgi:hypothetical protein
MAAHCAANSTRRRDELQLSSIDDADRRSRRQVPSRLHGPRNPHGQASRLHPPAA